MKVTYDFDLVRQYDAKLHQCMLHLTNMRLGELQRLEKELAKKVLK